MDAHAVEHILTGPPAHGVIRFGRHLHQALGQGVVREAPNPAQLPAPAADAELVHISFTDHLCGPDPQTAVDTVLCLAAGRPLSLTLHDIPQPGEGADRCARRQAAYLRLVRAADVVATNSESEARRLESAGAIHVVPLPIEAPRPLAAAPGPPTAGSSDGGTPVIGIFGFVYPGKGCEDVIDAAPAGTRILLLGDVADGHAGYLAGLRSRAAEHGIDLQCTGYIPDTELPAALDAVTVPVCAHRHVSASGSLNTWIAHNRVPLTTTSDYATEVAARWPGRLRLCMPSTLAEALAAACRTPASTWADTPPPDWGWAEVAAAYRRIWSTV
ncbi:glycosyltransferase family 4 protein [Brevibacterium luteolum]|uniref:Glycosyltransferase family 1 protein n=1 Tax=Brevibacterium luteolum TaxID=199591 RepID=A0A6G8KZ83_9MICO|nr:glycosyltransferase family 4 protein [Brevibacterium luteolum]QIN30089.1 glycosyltransferase family 1 protein [Brevibacterium luteolum]